jgi:hypothetical protein
MPFMTARLTKGLITVEDSFRVVVAREIARMPVEKVRLILDYEGVRLTMPKRFIPDVRFLKYHREDVFVG